MRARLAAGGVAAAVVVVAVVVVVLATQGGADASADEHAVPTSTATIVRRDLVETESEDGTLGYDDERTAPLKAAGTITWLPEEGATVRTNHRLLQVDGTDVYLLDGAVPAWRPLGPGADGADVDQLERDLRDLGCDPDHEMTVDGDWDAGTTAAVRCWQHRKGLDETGTIELGRVVFQPGTRRVGAIDAKLGGPAKGAIETTSTRRIVTVDLKTSSIELAKQGAQVTVELPSGSRVHGRIGSVGSVATLPKGGDVEASDATVPVTIDLASAKGAGGLDQAPVTVDFERSRAKDVLTIPVTALEAQSGGRYAVEVRDGASRRIVEVEPGLFASGDVAIEGKGLHAGMSVTNGAL